MAILRQITAVTAMNLRALPLRVTTSLVSVIGIAGVVLILVALLSISEGFRRTLELSGSDRVAIVLRGSSSAEMTSSFSRDQVQIIEQASGIARDAQGPIVSAELYTTVDQPKRSTGTAANAPFRGIEAAGPQTRSHFQLIAGRMFRTGTYEVIVGHSAAQTLSGLGVGSLVKWGNNVWRVVGEFSDGGSVSESEIWTDVHVLQSAYSRGDTYQTVRVLLTAAGTFKSFKDQLMDDPRLSANVLTEREFYAAQSVLLSTLVRGAGTVLALLMGVGAVFGALNTMYSAVAARSTEIATLRALGYGGLPVGVSVVIEALLLGLIGGCLGAAVAYLAFDGLQTSTMNYQSFTQVSFAFSVTPVLIITGTVYALLLALIGGLFPAVHAARRPIIAGLRQA
ncbi:MAG TPA: ABC transporter permease [Steroidobacteraceae bacterium]|jgi:putative ABC transport system permease protein|nr:ABC transporter permease [Steroidobacteraceae bacterium]